VSLIRPRVGIDLRSQSVRSVLVVRGSVARTATVSIEDAESPEAVVGRVLDSLCRGLWRKPRVFAAVGPSSSQVRRLANLPTVRSAGALQAIVRGSAGRFFLKNGVPLLTSSVRREDSGAGWAAAFEEPAVRALSEACKSRRLRLELTAPAIIALQRALTGELLVADDDDGVLVEAHVASDGALLDVRRATSSEGAAVGGATPIAAMRSLGERAIEYAGAYGATLIDRSEPLAVHARELPHWRNATVPRWRLLAAVGALLTTVGLAVALPALQASRVSTRAAARLAAINAKYRAAQWTEVELERTTSALEEIQAFERGRRSVTDFLAELTNALPESVWLQSVRVDRQGGTVIALAPRAASALAGLAELRSITSPVIVGGVSGEQLGADRIERVTIRFRWRTSERESAMTASNSRAVRK
jgi:hypothetical protein